MKAAHRTILTKAVLAAAPDLVGRWPLLHLPIGEGNILQGVCFERSSDPDGAYVWAFVQPLYVLKDTIILSHGDRLGGGSKLWYPAEAQALTKAMTSVGLPYLRSISTPRQFARVRALADRTDANALEAKGCSLIASGDFIEGIRTLRQIPAHVHRDTPWMCDLEERTQALADAAERAPERAMEMLAVWAASTKRALKL